MLGWITDKFKMFNDVLDTALGWLRDENAKISVEIQAQRFAESGLDSAEMPIPGRRVIDAPDIDVGRMDNEMPTIAAPELPDVGMETPSIETPDAPSIAVDTPKMDAPRATAPVYRSPELVNIGLGQLSEARKQTLLLADINKKEIAHEVKNVVDTSVVESNVLPMVAPPQANNNEIQMGDTIVHAEAVGDVVEMGRPVLEMPEVVVIAETLKEEVTHATDTIYKEMVKEVAPVEMEALGTAGVEMVEPVIEVPKEIAHGNNIEASIERPVVETDRVDVGRSTIENNEISTVVYTARPENERGKQGLVQNMVPASPQIDVTTEPMVNVAAPEEVAHATDTIYKEVVKEVAPVEMATLGTASVEMVEPVIEMPEVRNVTEVVSTETAPVVIDTPMVETGEVVISNPAQTEMVSPELVVPIIDAPDVEVPTMNTVVESSAIPEIQSPMVDVAATEVASPSVEVSSPIVDVITPSVEVPEAKTDVEAVTGSDDLRTDSPPLVTDTITETPDARGDDIMAMVAPNVEMSEIRTPAPVVGQGDMAATTIEVPQAHVIVDSPEVIASTAPMVTVAMPDMATGDAVIPPAPAPAVEVPAVDVPPTVVENNVVETVSPSVADIGSLDMPVVNIENTPTIDAQEITLPNAPPTLVLQEYEAPESDTNTIERERIEERGSTDDSGAQTAPVNNVTVNFTINQTPGQDPEELARVILRHIDQSTETFLIQ